MSLSSQSVIYWEDDGIREMLITLYLVALLPRLADHRPLKGLIDLIGEPRAVDDVEECDDKKDDYQQKEDLLTVAAQMVPPSRLAVVVGTTSGPLLLLNVIVVRTVAV